MCCMNKISVLIADDHPGFRDGLARMLDEIEDFECVGKSADGRVVVDTAKKLKPDIVLLDVVMPNLDGIRAAKEIRKYCPKTYIIVLSAFDYEAYILSSLRAGARGYILKTSSLDKIINTIQLVYRGESVLDTSVCDKLVNQMQVEESDDGRINNKIGFNMLQPRELEVIALAARGMSNKEIANDLFISERTVQTHLVNIFKKLGASSRTQAVLCALKEGWVELDDTRK